MRTFLILILSCVVGSAFAASSEPARSGAADAVATDGAPGPNDPSLTDGNCANLTPHAPTPSGPSGGGPSSSPSPQPAGYLPGDGQSGTICVPCFINYLCSFFIGDNRVDSTYMNGVNDPLVGNAAGTNDLCQPTIKTTEQDSATGDNPAGSLWAGPTADAAPTAAGGGCASCGGASGFPGLLPGALQSPMLGVPQMYRYLYTKDSQGLQSLGDQQMNWDLVVKTAWNAGSGTALFTLTLPNASVPLDFVTSDAVTFSSVPHVGRAVAASCVRVGDDIVVTSEFGDRFIAPIPAGFDITAPNRLPCREARARLGAVFTLAYDDAGDLVSVQGPMGRLSFAWTTFDGAPVVASVVGADGRTTAYEYADVFGSPSLHRVTHPDGSVDTFTYDFTPITLANYTPINHRLIVHRSNYIWDRTRDVTYYLEPRLGLAVLVEDALGRDLYNRIANGVTDGQVWRYIYDQRGRARIFWYDGNADLSRIQDPNTGFDRVVTANGLNQLVGVQDELGRHWSYGYEADSFLPIARTYPDGSSDAQTLQPGTHQPTSSTDRLGRTTTITRNAQGLPVDVVFADGAHEHNDFNAIGQVVRHVDALGRETQSFYAADGDPAHAPATWDDPANLGYLVAVRLPQDASETSAPTWTYRWDAAVGDLTTAFDPTGRVFAFTYDLMHRATSCTYADGSSDSVEYGAPNTPDVGLVVARTDRDGRRTTFTYDASGLEIQRTLADGGVITKAYDLFGRLVEKTTFGDTEDYTYDAAARLIAVTRHPTVSTTLTTTTTYDSQDRRIAVSDPYGRTAFDVYDVNGRVVRHVQELIPGAADEATFMAAHAGDPPVVATAAWQQHLADLSRGGDPNLVITDMSYLANGLVASTTDGRGIVTAMAYDVRDRVVAQTVAVATPDEATSTMTYDAVGNVISQTDPRGLVTAMTYTARDREATRRFAVGTPDEAVVAMTYTPTDKIASRTDERGFTTRYLYCACCDRLEDIVDPLGFDTHIAYDPVGNRTAITDANGLTTSATYDARDRVLSTTNGAGETTTFAYADDASGVAPDLGFGPGAAGSVVQMTDPLGEMQTNVSDATGRVVRSIDPLGDATTTTYDAVVVDAGSALIESTATDALGHTTRARADALGRVLASVDATGAVTRKTYDADGNVVSVRDANGVGQDCVYDARNRRVACTDTAGAVTTWRYDADSNLVAQTDALGATTSMGYDARNRRITTTDRISATTVFAYDPANNLVTITDAEGGTTSYAYDPRNLLVSETFPPPTGGTRQYAYDGGRRLVQRVDQIGVATTYAYDNANRLITRAYSSGAAPDTFAYDHASRLITAQSGRYADLVARSYDAAGRLTAESLTLDGVAFPVRYQYDAANRVISLTYPSGSVVGHGYTERNELADVSFAGSAVAHRVYDDGGRLIETDYGNGVVERRGYIAGDNLIASIIAPGVVSSAPITQFGYDYDADKRKLHETDAALPDATQAFAYDAEGRLTGWQRGSASPSTQSWNLSPVGDWRSTTIDGVTQVRTHTPVHEIAAINGLPVLSDPKGNLSLQLSPFQTFAWDDENRLVAAAGSGPRGLFVAHYRYDALGRRVQKRVNGVRTTWVDAGAQQIVELVGDPAKAPWLDPHEDLTPPVTGIGPHGSLLQQAGTLHIDFRPDADGAEAGWLADTGEVAADHGDLHYGWDHRRPAIDRGYLDQPEWDSFVRMMPGRSVGTWSIALADGSYPVVIVMGDPASRDQTNSITVSGVEIDDPTPAQEDPEGYEQGAFDGYAIQATVTGGHLTIAPVAGVAHDPKICFIEIGPQGGTIDDATRDRVAQATKRMTEATTTRRGRNARAAETVYGSYVDEPLALITSSGRFYYHANHLYSVAALTDRSGAPVERYRYDAYGERTVLDGAGTTVRTASRYGNQVGFTGRYHDDETGLIYFRYRQFSPKLGRFIGRDPYEYISGASLYAAYFVPNFMDPTGLKVEYRKVKIVVNGEDEHDYDRIESEEKGGESEHKSLPDECRDGYRITGESYNEYWKVTWIMKNYTVKYVLDLNIKVTTTANAAAEVNGAASSVLVGLAGLTPGKLKVSAPSLVAALTSVISGLYADTSAQVDVLEINSNKIRSFNGESKQVEIQERPVEAYKYKEDPCCNTPSSP